MMRVKVKQTIKDFVMVDGQFKSVEVIQKLTFATWNDFQNWIGYTVEALEGRPLKIEVEIAKEDDNE